MGRENDKTDSKPLERKKSIPFDNLIHSVALGSRDEDTLTSVAGRLAALDREIDDKDRQEIKNVAGGKSLKASINRLLDATNPDKQIEKAQGMFKTEAPTQEQMKKATEELVKVACTPFDNPILRNAIIDIKQRNEQVIDEVSKDQVLVA